MVLGAGFRIVPQPVSSSGVILRIRTARTRPFNRLRFGVSVRIDHQKTLRRRRKHREVTASQIGGIGRGIVPALSAVQLKKLIWRERMFYPRGTFGASGTPHNYSPRKYAIVRAQYLRNSFHNPGLQKADAPRADSMDYRRHVRYHPVSHAKNPMPVRAKAAQFPQARVRRQAATRGEFHVHRPGTARRGIHERIRGLCRCAGVVYPMRPGCRAARASYPK